MGIDRFDRFKKTQWGSDTYGQRTSLRHAQSTAEQFNEPAVILEGPDEFVVIRGIAWHARNTWAKADLPSWAQKDPESKRVTTVYPEDRLAGHHRAAGNIMKRLLKKTMDIRYEDRFDLEQLFRDYPRVRSQMSIAEKQAEALYLTLIHVQTEVEDAIDDHKKNGQPKDRLGEDWGGEPSE